MIKTIEELNKVLNDAVEKSIEDTSRKLEEHIEKTYGKEFIDMLKGE